MLTEEHGLRMVRMLELRTGINKMMLITIMRSILYKTLLTPKHYYKQEAMDDSRSSHVLYIDIHECYSESGESSRMRSSVT
jgi:hypothetical protein